MMKTTTALALAFWTTLAAAQEAPESAPPPAPSNEPVRVIESDRSVGAALKLRVDLAIGDVVVRGEDVDRISVRLLIFCDKKPRDRASCDEHARDLAISGSSDGDVLKVGVDGDRNSVSRRLRLRLELRLPKSLAVEVNVRDGQVRVDDLVASTKVEVDQGTIDLTLPEADVEELELKAGGTARVERGGDLITAKGTLRGELRWKRAGGVVRVKASSALGDVRVVLK
jgi:hypothetical protein